MSREPLSSLSPLGRTVEMDQRIRDVPAGQAPKSLHPHRQITFLHIQEMVHNHQAITFRAGHGIPSFCDWPSAAARAHYVVSRIRNDDARRNCVLLRRRNGALVLNQRDDLRVQVEMPSNLVVLYRISLDTVGMTKRYSVRRRQRWSVM
jgi:hypothetical protein